jgi:hypothetical protein
MAFVGDMISLAYIHKQEMEDRNSASWFVAIRDPKEEEENRYAANNSYIES